MEFASIVVSRMELRCFYDVACATRLMPIEASRLTRGDFPRMIAQLHCGKEALVLLFFSLFQQLLSWLASCNR